jgi:hypothetical protein
VKDGKSTTKTLEMLHEAFGEHSLNDIHISWPVECPLKMMKVQAGEHQQNHRKC